MNAMIVGCIGLMTQAPGGVTLSAAERLRLRTTPVVQVFSACKGAVVNISTAQFVTVRSPTFMFDRLFDDLFDFPTGPNRQFKTTAVGSGIVIHPAGYIVTNAHVVARTAERKATFVDQQSYDAQVIAVDADHDLALLKIAADRPLPALAFGRSDDLLIGETAIAIGNPLGLQHTVTTGVISALERELQVRDQVVYRGLIQTDASINPGNSGGPLLNILGELIGVNTAIRGDAQNIGFAIPVGRLVERLPAMLDIERRYRLILGVTVAGGAPAVIAEVTPNTPAANAGLAVGDIITAIDNDPVGKGVDFYIQMIDRAAGVGIGITLARAGRPVKTTLVPIERPKPDGRRLAREKFGLELDLLSDAVARKLGMPRLRGLVVRQTEPGGPAERVGVEPGDIIVQLGQHQAGDLDDLGLILEKMPAGTTANLVVLRIGNQTLYRLAAEIKAR